MAKEKSPNVVNLGLSNEVRKKVVENFKQLILSLEHEAEIKVSGLLETSVLLVKELQENHGHISTISDVRINDSYHISHNINVASLSVVIGIKMGMRIDDLKKLALACLIHDIGKLKIPKQILSKPERLAPKEFELVKLHVPLGAKMAKEELKMNKEICDIILQHHERFDGSGYPRGLPNSDTHLFAQIIALTDSFDALSSDRPYAKVKAPKDIIKEFLSMNSKFNPQVLHTLIYMV